MRCFCVSRDLTKENIITCIAWDGKTLAADKRAVNNGLIRTTTKIFKLSNGELFAGCGDFSFCLHMKEWVEQGCNPDTFPTAQKDKDDWQVCCVVSKDGLRVYERTPYPLIFDDKFYSCGSGRDYAHTAMYLGKTSAEAVEIACLFDNGCGNGVDTLTL